MNTGNAPRVFIVGKHNGYAPTKDSVGRTLTVRELVYLLEQNFDEDSPIYLCNDGGYTYGSITEQDIFEDDKEDETYE